MANEDFIDEKPSAKKKATVTEKNTEKVLKSEIFMYVGPNIPRLGLETYALYKGKISANVEEAIAKIPEIQKLIIPVDELNSFTHKLLIPSSPERQYYATVKWKMREI